MGEKTFGKLEERAIHSEFLHETVTVLVYLPANYSPLYKQQLIIAQDGRDYFQLGRIHRAAEALMEIGDMPSSIIIGIPYKDINDRRQKYHPDGSQHKAYQRFLAEELVPWLDHEFPTFQMGRTRMLIGDSLAGTASLLAGLSYPHTFGKIVLQSPYVNDEVLQQLNRFHQPQSLELYHAVGTKELAVPTTDGKVSDFLTANRNLNQSMQARGFHVHYEEFDGDHSWTYWQPNIKEALQTMSGE